MGTDRDPVLARENVPHPRAGRDPVAETLREARGNLPHPALDRVAAPGLVGPQVAQKGGAVMARHLAGLRRHSVGGRAHKGGDLRVHGPKDVVEGYCIERSMPGHLHDRPVVADLALGGVGQAAHGTGVSAPQSEPGPDQRQPTAKRERQAEGIGLEPAALDQAPVLPNGRHLARHGNRLGTGRRRQAAHGRLRVADEVGACDQPIGIAPPGRYAPAQAVFGLQQHHVAVTQFPGRGEPRDAPADHDYLVPLARHPIAPAGRIRRARQSVAAVLADQDRTRDLSGS